MLAISIPSGTSARAGLTVHVRRLGIVRLAGPPIFVLARLWLASKVRLRLKPCCAGFRAGLWNPGLWPGERIWDCGDSKLSRSHSRTPVQVLYVPIYRHPPENYPTPTPDPITRRANAILPPPCR